MYQFQVFLILTLKLYVKHEFMDCILKKYMINTKFSVYIKDNNKYIMQQHNSQIINIIITYKMV